MLVGSTGTTVLMCGRIHPLLRFSIVAGGFSGDQAGLGLARYLAVFGCALYSTRPALGSRETGNSCAARFETKVWVNSSSIGGGDGCRCMRRISNDLVDRIYLSYLVQYP